MTNRLSREKSPYLLQHAENPVDWYPWGDEAFQKARQEDKPIFLSIGYATCHWCHVMERESFEDEEVAALLNEHLVSIKVDREERPDVDHVYMSVCQSLTGSGGWPLSIFMTPDRQPFYAGSYFPRTSRMGMPGFMDVITQLASLWRDDRQRLTTAGQEIAMAIQPRVGSGEGRQIGLDTLEGACRHFLKSFDVQFGGFGGAPKFPTPHHLTFLLRQHRRDPGCGGLGMVEKTLNSIRDGGIFDHIGFGFHRYSVDKRWLVPHFEKMLYDQAMLAMAYLDAWQMTKNDRYNRTAREILDYVLRDMTDPDGGFYSAEDADSEGEEGLFYVWTPSEVRNVLGDEAAEVFCRTYDITESGNFEQLGSIPHLERPLEEIAAGLGIDPGKLRSDLEDSRVKLFNAREKRVHPLKDDKILTSWNGLMIAALARAMQTLGEDRYGLAATRAAEFILSSMTDGEGRLCRRFRHGELAGRAFAEDYAFLIWGLLELYEAGFNPKYLYSAIRLQQEMTSLFADDVHGGFFFTARDSEELIVRDREIYDGATPSSNSVALLNLLRLSRVTGRTGFEEEADRLVRGFSGMILEYPPGYTQFLNAIDFSIGPTREVVLVGERGDRMAISMLEALRAVFDPNRVLLLLDSESAAELGKLAPYTAGMPAAGPNATVYICENFSCQSPITDVEALKSAIG